MTLSEFASLCQTTVCAKSGFNGKILCWSFNPEKHVEIGEREVLSAWCELKVDNNGYSSFVRPIISVFVEGKPEFEKEAIKKRKADGVTKK